MEYLVAAYTDTGVRKETNQDSICVRRASIVGSGETVLAVVCDGMGGLKKGEVASAAAVNAFGRWFDDNLQQLPALCCTEFSQVRLQWWRLVEKLHQELLRYSAKTQIQLGTTVAAFFAYGDRYLTMNIGDSRVYERKSAFRQLTKDQSLVAREVAAGRITEEESRHHPQRNVLLQCVGAGEHITPVFSEGKVQNKALYLLCSDGLCHEMSLEELEEHFQYVYLVSKDAMTAALKEATELCERRGETDNITALLIKTRESDYLKPKKAGMEKLKRMLHIASSNTNAQPAILLETAQITHTKEVIGHQ